MSLLGAIHFDAQYSPSDDGWHWEGIFKKWEAVAWKEGERARWASGTNALTMWDWIRQIALARGGLTLYGWRIWPLWCVSRGIEEVTARRIVLDVSGSNPKGFFIASNPPTIIRMQGAAGGEIKLIDLANFGLEPSAYNVTGNEGALSASKQAVEDYHWLCDNFHMGRPCGTAASQAWQAYKYCREPIPGPIPPASDGQSELEESAYVGGRAECLKLGDVSERLWHLDVTSMYTAIGLKAMFPREYVGCWTPTSHSTLPPFERNEFLQIADVTISTPTPLYPASDCVRLNHLRQPNRRDGDERVIYPTGTFRTVLCGPELAMAVGNNQIVKWHRVQYYEPAALMASWSKWALEMRETIKTGQRKHLSRCVKTIINSLPGKWGQRAKLWIDDKRKFVYPASRYEAPQQWGQEYGRHPTTGRMTEFRTIAGHSQYLENEYLSEGSCPAVAAFWTSYGRVLLLARILIAGWENVFYYHTDSLKVNYKGFCNLQAADMISPGELTEPGMLRLISNATDAKLLGINRYYFDGKWVVAGLPPGQLEHEGFGKQMWSHNVGRAVEQPSMADGIQSYKHGTVLDDGRVIPFIVGK